MAREDNMNITNVMNITDVRVVKLFDFNAKRVPASLTTKRVLTKELFFSGVGLKLCYELQTQLSKFMIKTNENKTIPPANLDFKRR